MLGFDQIESDQAGLATAHQNMHCQLLKNLAPESTEVLVLDHATSHPIAP
ncbi:hypothetical protein ACWDSF_14000 [Nocardia beijingensis]|nr:hypothetical protein [Nocardia beijingensis]